MTGAIMGDFNPTIKRPHKILIETRRFIATGVSGWGTFNDIPQGFNRLRIEIRGGTTAAAVAYTGVNVQVNGDTGVTNYAYSYDTSAGDGQSTAAAFMAMGLLPGATATANCVGIIDAEFIGYSELKWHKQMICTTSINSASPAIVGQYAGGWKNTAAIKSIQMSTSGFITAGSTISLFGMYDMPF